jgi:hypothetical protein
MLLITAIAIVFLIMADLKHSIEVSGPVLISLVGTAYGAILIVYLIWNLVQFRYEILELILKVLDVNRISKLKIPGGTEVEFTPSVSTAVALQKAGQVTEQGFPEQENYESDLGGNIVAKVQNWTHLYKHVFRPSLVNYNMETYREYARVDPRGAIRASRIGLENMFRNRLELGDGLYFSGEKIETVLERLIREESRKQQSKWLPHAELGAVLFKLIDAADEGKLFSYKEACTFIGFAQCIRDRYITWITVEIDSDEATKKRIVAIEKRRAESLKGIARIKDEST